MQERPAILVDADSCPVKDEIYKVAMRHQFPVCIVANSYLRVPNHRLISQVTVSDTFDAADDFIASKVVPDSLVVTADILLADRCIKSGGRVLAPNGIFFTADSIGAAVATRNLMEDLRAGGEQHGGPPPFSKKDRSLFLSSLHLALMELIKKSTTAS